MVGSVNIADATAEADRPRTYALLNAVWGAALLMGPALGGWLGTIHVRLPFLVAAGLALLNAVLAAGFLPESLPVARRRPFRWRRAHPLAIITLTRENPGLGRLVAVDLLYSLACAIIPQTLILYLGYRYHWSSAQIGLTATATGLCMLALNLGPVGPLVKRLGTDRAIRGGLLLDAAGFAAFGAATSGAWVLVATPVQVLSGLYESVRTR